MAKTKRRGKKLEAQIERSANALLAMASGESASVGAPRRHPKKPSAQETAQQVGRSLGEALSRATNEQVREIAAAQPLGFAFLVSQLRRQGHLPGSAALRLGRIARDMVQLAGSAADPPPEAEKPEPGPMLSPFNALLQPRRSRPILPRGKTTDSE